MKWLLVLSLLITGCSWQGQKHQEFDGKDITINSEWWSMRFLWMSGGIESQTETPYYKSGANIKTSVSDANSVKAIVEGTVEGLKVF